MADALASCRADLVICARNLDRCETAAAEIREAHGVRVVAVACDVRREADVDRVVSRAVDEFGRIDILVNNSGTSWGAPAVDYPLEGWQKVIDVNLTGSFLMAQRVGRVLIEQGEGGKIINVSSVLALRGSPAEAVSAVAYNASKGGLISMTTDLAVAWGKHRICVNAIAPGWFPTEMSSSVLDASGEGFLSRIPLGRFGGDHDLKGAVVFLASAASDYVTGHTLAVEGGHLAA